MSNVHHGQWRESADALVGPERDAIEIAVFAWMAAASHGVTDSSTDCLCGVYVGGGLVVTFALAIRNGYKSHFHTLTVVADGEVVLNMREEPQRENASKAAIWNLRYLVETYQRGSWEQKLLGLATDVSEAMCSDFTSEEERGHE